MKTLMSERIVTFKRLHNFRDIGGLPTVGGKMMKSGLFYRSESMHFYSKAELDRIKSLGIKSVLDLRTPEEVSDNKYNSFKGSNTKVLNIPINPFPDKKMPRKKDFLSPAFLNKFKDIDLVSMMTGNYHRIAFDCHKEIKQILTFLSDEENLPAIIHCSAGKDRTGFISYLLQSLAGVDSDTIHEDYLLTNDYMFNGKDVKKQELLFKILTLGKFNLNVFRPYQEAKPEYLKSVSEEIIKNHKTVEEYLVEYCMIQREVIDRLKMLLVKASLY
jgi:protein-tyrosine phosphatase